MINKIIDNDPNRKNRSLIKCANPACNNVISKHTYTIKVADPNAAFCCSHKCKNSEFIRKHHSDMMIQKYGVSCVFKLDNIKEKIKKTNIEKYGVDNVFKLKDKIRKAVKKKYGVEHVMQSSKIKEKLKNTIIQKYGSIEKYHKHVKRKTLETQIKKYGTWFFGSKEGKMNREDLINKWGHTPEECDEIARKKSENRNGGRSRIADECFNKLIKMMPLNLHKDVIWNNNELYLFSEDLKVGCRYDFTYKNKIIEFNGDYWHANPKKFKEDELIRCGKEPKPAKHIWEKDRSKIEIAKIHGYKVYVIWEDEYMQNKENVLNLAYKFLME